MITTLEPINKNVSICLISKTIEYGINSICGQSARIWNFWQLILLKDVNLFTQQTRNKYKQNIISQFMKFYQHLFYYYSQEKYILSLMLTVQLLTCTIFYFWQPDRIIHWQKNHVLVIIILSYIFYVGLLSPIPFSFYFLKLGFSEQTKLSHIAMFSYYYHL